MSKKGFGKKQNSPELPSIEEMKNHNDRISIYKKDFGLYTLYLLPNTEERYFQLVSNSYTQVSWEKSLKRGQYTFPTDNFMVTVEKEYSNKKEMMEDAPSMIEKFAKGFKYKIMLDWAYKTNYPEEWVVPIKVID